MPTYLIRVKGTKKWTKVDAINETAAVREFTQYREKDHYSLNNSQKTFSGGNIHLKTVAVDIKLEKLNQRHISPNQSQLQGKIKKQMKLGG